MNESRKSPGIERERISNLQKNVVALSDKLEQLEQQQLNGDWSVETAREIGVVSNRIIVAKNRIAGKFEDDRYKLEIEIKIPKPQQK